MSIKRCSLTTFITTSVLVGICQSAWASGLQLLEQNVTHLGTAYAGTASLAEDASTGFYNPAGLTRLGEEQITVSTILINAHAKLSGDSATSTSLKPLEPGTAKGNGRGLLPTLHYAKRMNERWVFGFNLTSPFGAKNNYRNDAVTRYLGTRSELRTLDMSPSLAYAFDNGVSLGLGVSGLYTLAKLNSALDVTPPGSLIPGTDGYLENTADGWSWGYHAGVLWEISECTRIGVNCRSKFKVHAKGHALQSFVAATNNSPLRQGLKADVTLPETATLSIHQGLGEKWAVMADLQWTKWSRFKNLTLRYDDNNAISTEENFKSTLRVALGLTYQQDEAWLWRMGLAHDKTPTRDAYRTIRIPDANRTWGALGGQYRFCDALTLDFGYAHLFSKKVRIEEKAPTTLSVPVFQSLKGSSKASANLFGLQLTWDFV
jgi:long-chain fatty acid transport protein